MFLTLHKKVVKNYLAMVLPFVIDLNERLIDLMSDSQLPPIHGLREGLNLHSMACKPILVIYQLWKFLISCSETCHILLSWYIMPIINVVWLPISLTLCATKMPKFLSLFLRCLQKKKLYQHGKEMWFILLKFINQFLHWISKSSGRRNQFFFAMIIEYSAWAQLLWG